MTDKVLIIFTIFLLALMIIGMEDNEQSKEQLAPFETVENLHSNSIFINHNEVLIKVIDNSHLKMVTK